MRARLALHAARALGIRAGDAARLAAAVELLHNASLVHDDLQDQEVLRRGRPSVWSAFGSDVAICVGDLLLSSAYGTIASFEDVARVPALLRRVHERTSQVIHGQCRELAGKDRPVLDLAQYEQIVTGKSGALLSLPMELAFIAASQPGWCARVQEATQAFGVGYQMLDDLEDLAVDAAGHNLNVVLLLESAGVTGDARALVRQHALRHLDRSAALAGGLPGETGALLVDYALQLRKRLRGE